MKNISTLQDKTILLVNTGSIKKRFILQKLKKLGLKIVCLNKEKNWAQPYVDHWILTEKNSYAEVAGALKAFIADHPEVKIDGVVTFWEDDVLLASRIADRFNFIGIPYAVARKVRNKFLFREFCRETGLPAPKHILIKSAADIHNLPEDLRFPLVIKPVFGASSAYVVKVENKEEMLHTYDYIRKNMSTHVESALSDGFDILAEEYIAGDEVDIDIVLQNGKIKFHSISDNYQTKEPFFIETGQSIPSGLSEKIKADLVSLAEEVLEKIGVQNGVIHFEAKSTPTGPVPIEVNLRMGGDEVYSFVKGAWGVDLIENAVKIALGMYIPKIERPEMPKKYMAGSYFLSDYSGILSKLEVKAELKQYKFLEEVHFFKKVADAVLVPPEGYEYLGWVTVSGYSMPDAQDNLKKALRCVQFEVARFASESSIGKTLRKNSFSQASLTSSLLIHAAKIEKFRRITPEDKRKLHIGIACNIYDESDGAVENELATVGRNIQDALVQRGYKTTFFNFNDIEKAFKELSASDVDLVFNVCERINNSSLLEPHAASLFDILQIPYTGSNPSTLSLCIDKIRVKKLLAYHKIPTPRWDYAYTIDDDIDENLRYPLIVKPANTDNSIGISNDSVVTTKEALREQLKKIIVDVGSPALIEEYIEGDEYDVSILGSEDNDLVVLPLSRSIFKNMPEGQWHIYTNEMKFGQKKVEDFGVVIQRPPKNISKRLESLLTEISLDTYNILDCHDYGRVEIRVDEYDNPYVLELNPNPSININDCVSSVAHLSGLEYGDFLEQIITMAISRYRNRPPYYHLKSNPM
ncbi:MAG: ATP-grasp domain-containing protein [Candidatus Buchananbacteria bacterium]|nr:ATP-grasp domain-containing protein [Candidatus Buchananbacteria bacterium]